MQDADLLTELCQIILEGTFTRSKSSLENLYKVNDGRFERKNEVEEKLKNIIDYIKINLNDIRKIKMLKGYSFYSLVSALVYNKWGIVNINYSKMN